MRHVIFILGRVPLLAALAIDAAARAGGGEGYSGFSDSSDFSGSSSYSGHDGGDLLFSFLPLYLNFVLAYPLFGLPLTIFLLYALYALWKLSSGLNVRHGVFSASGGNTPQGRQLSPRKAEELARLTERDPAFTEREFLRRAGAAFLRIQDAWSSGDMAPARAFISDGVCERFERQLADLKTRGLRNLMEGVEIRDCELLACRSDKHFDVLWVRVAAAASDRMVDAEGATVSDSPGRQAFEEVWTFLRRPGAKTLSCPGLIEGGCPNCGALLPIADAAQCAVCKTWVNSGQYDWVLAEITQSCEWVLREPARDVDGWATAAAADPALNLPVLEDRASVIFWRWLDARRLLDIGPLRSVADDAFCRAFAKSAADKTMSSFRDAAIGVVAVAAFEDAGAWTRVHIGVKWSGRQASGDVELRRHFFVLSRERGAKTDVRQGLRTARCPSCGAASNARSEGACAYCGTALNDGKKDWVLTAVVPFGRWKRPPNGSVSGIDWGAEMSPADAFAVLARAMLVDGEVSLAEKAFLDAYAKSRALPPVKATEIIAAARAGLLDVPKATDGNSAEAMLRGMIRMSLANGVVTEDERAALCSFAARFELRSDDVAVMIVEEREHPGQLGLRRCSRSRSFCS